MPEILIRNAMGEIESIDQNESKNRLNFDYLSSADFFTPADFQNNTDELHQRIQERCEHPLNDTLVLQKISDEVGYGLFVHPNKKILAGTIIDVYTGDINISIANQSFYAFGLSENHQLDASKRGNLTRFIQHMPHDVENILYAIQSANQDQLIRLLKGSNIHDYQDLGAMNFKILKYNDELSGLKNEYSEYLRLLSDVASIATSLFSENSVKLSAEELFTIKLIVFYKLKHEFLASQLKDELSLKKFLDKPDVSKKLAYANISAYNTTINGKPCAYLIANVEINASEQLGFSYGLDYWISAQKMPRYFHKNGTILQTEDYLGSLNNLLLKYKGKDCQLPTTETALRRATYLKSTEDVCILLEYGAKINDLSPSGKTAYDLLQKNDEETKNLLLNYRAMKAKDLPNQKHLTDFFSQKKSAQNTYSQNKSNDQSAFKNRLTSF
jgi:hypothetical protein